MGTRKTGIGLALLMAALFPGGDVAAAQAVLDGASEETDVLPEDIDEILKEVGERGTLIFEMDIAAARAADLLLSKSESQNDPRLAGWITQPLEEETWRVLFYGSGTVEPIPLYAVDVVEGKAVAKSFTVFPEGALLTDEQRRMIIARQRALSAPIEACSNAYNTVVTPDSGGRFFVYLLAATTQRSVIIVGGHYRRLINTDTGEILETKRFTGSCLNMQIPPGVVAVVSTNSIALYPEETYVFLSLLHRMPIYVLTVKNGVTWSVDGAEIRQVSQKGG